MSKLFLFGIGGTGARVLRSFTMLLASGVKGFDSSMEIVPIILDHDKGNGDLTRTKTALTTYREINRALYPDGGSKTYADTFFATRLTPLSEIGTTPQGGTPSWHVQFGAAAAAQNGLKYSDYIGLSSIAARTELEPTASLIEGLYDDSPSTSPDAELNLDLNVGFKGNPSIGTVVFNELKNDPNFRAFLANCQPANGDKVFIVGSIFGGTGSSGIPVIVDEIRKATVGTVAQVPVGVALVLPYFKLQPMNQNSDPDDTGAIDSSMFNAKTKAALGAYAIGGDNAFNNKVTDLYYIGDNYADSYEYHEGNNKQVNSSHVVEWVAATAIVDFIHSNDSYGTTTVKEFGILPDDNSEAIRLPDLPMFAKTNYVDQLTAFLLAMRYYREVTVGTRNKINSSAAYYNTFNLGSSLGTGVYAKLDTFVIDPNWGFYRWLEELENHTHTFKPYRIDAEGKDLRNVLAHKISDGGRWGRNHIKDSDMSSKINNLTKNSGNKPAEFIKALHDAATATYDQIKN